MIQKYIRGMQTRKKFQRLKKCLELITRIQRAFRKRFKFVNDKATKIQSEFRKALAKDRYNRKKQRYDTSLVDPEEEYYDSSDEDQIRQVKERKKKRELDRKIEKQKQLQDEIRKGREKERQKRLDNEVKKMKDKEFKRKKSPEKQKKAEAKKQKEKIKKNKKQAKNFYNYFNDLGGDGPSNKNSNYLGIGGGTRKRERKDDLYDLENEKDTDKIISALLLDKNLMRDNEEMNRLLANENGVKKDVRYKLLQLENPTSKQNKNSSVDKNNNNNYYINGNLRSNKNEDNKGKRIEDKLLEYGKALKQKKAQERVNKLKAEEEECTFKPKVRKNKEWMRGFEDKGLKARAALFEKRKEKDLENAKKKIKDPNKGELTFKPKISKNSKNMKRHWKDLLQWGEQRQKRLENQQKEKKKKEDEEFELNQQTSFMGNRSKILLSRKSRASSKNYNYNDTNNLGNDMNMNNMGMNYVNPGMNENNEFNENYEPAFDLWPNYLERKFYDEKEEIPLPGKKNNNNELNNLDFIGNKKEFNENKIGENDEEENEDDDEEGLNEGGYNDYHNINNE